MSNRATGTFAMKSWDEKPYNEVEGELKMVRVSSVTSYAGELEGQGALDYLMVYRPDGATFVGLERFVGKVGGVAGSFVLQHDGVFAGGLRQNSKVIPGSGTGGLAGISGTMRFEGGEAQTVPTVFEYDLPG